MKWIIGSLFLICGCTENIKTESLTQLGTLPLELEIPIEKQDTSLALIEDWVDLQSLDPSIAVDLRYATTQNFVGVQMYACARCILREKVAAALISVQKSLQFEGLSLKVFDCYRPKSVQLALWERVPDARYVTPPSKGSMHNRGAAVDLTLIDETGNELDMGTTYDFFGPEAYHTFTNHPDQVIKNRLKLKELMSKAGFKHIRTEWWHYSFQNVTYELSDYRWPCPDRNFEMGMRQ